MNNKRNLKILIPLLLFSLSACKDQRNSKEINNISIKVQEQLEAIIVNADFQSVGFERTSWFKDIIEHESAKKNINPNLVWALLSYESRGNLTAQSKTGPRGLGQFTKATGKAYDLDRFQRNSKVITDERLNPNEAIRATTEHLADLYKTYSKYGEEATFFVLAAYNQGTGRVNAAIKKAMIINKNTNWNSVEKYLPLEGQKYVPAIMAKKIILDRPDLFPEIKISSNAHNLYNRIKKFTISKKTNGLSIRDYAKKYGYNLEHLRLLNPEFVNLDAKILNSSIIVPNKQKINDFNKLFENFKKLKWDVFLHTPKNAKKNPGRTAIPTKKIPKMLKVKPMPHRRF